MFSFSKQFFCCRGTADPYFPVKSLCEGNFLKSSPLWRLWSPQVVDEKWVQCNDCNFLMGTIVKISHLQIFIYSANTSGLILYSSSLSIIPRHFSDYFMLRISVRYNDSQNLRCIKITKSPGGLVKMLQVWRQEAKVGDIPRVFDSVGFWWDLRICIRWDPVICIIVSSFENHCSSFLASDLATDWNYLESFHPTTTTITLKFLI